MIGLEVFDRNEHYDPRLDSIVRVEAGRLRSKIDEYYNGPGRDDAVLIQMRRGSYAPVFEHRQSSSSVATPRPAPPPPRRSGRRLALGVSSLAFILLVWTALTWGAAEQRFVSPAVIGNPAEIFGSFKTLWFERALTRNLAASIWRVVQGFGLAALVGVPLGILSGAFPKFGAFIAPVSVFGRNVPISALVPLTLLWFGIEELQKVMFIFVACLMFVVFDAARAIADVHERYVQTALTLGASSRQVLFKVLVPLALPDIFGSLRLLFGLAFLFLLVIVLHYSLVISSHRESIRRLTQTVALLERALDDRRQR